MPGARVASGERVTLRTTEREDVPFLQRSFTNPGLRYPLGNPTVKNQDGVEERFEDESSTNLLVCLDGEDAGPGQPDDEDVTRIGSVSVTDVPWSRTEIGYWLVPECHGEGYGTEAVALLVEYTFRTSGTRSIEAMAYDFNEASRGLLESLGFSQEGRKRKANFVDGEYRDAVIYGILREEWDGP